MPSSTFKSTTTAKRTPATNKPGDDDDRSCGRGRSSGRDERGTRRIGRGRGRVISEGNSSRKRLGTVVTDRVSDSESDLDCISTCTDMSSSSDGNKQLHVLLRQAFHDRKPDLRRSIGLKELKTCDECSSQSSIITDEDGGDLVSMEHKSEGTIQAVQTAGKEKHLSGNNGEDRLLDAMSKELRQAVNEIRLDLLHAMEKSETHSLANNNYIQPSSYTAHQTFSANGEKHVPGMEQSVKHKPNLSTEMMLEEQHSGELSKAVISLLPDSMVAEKTTGGRKADDRFVLIEEADRIIEDFISNVEDTDIPLINGESCDARLSSGGIRQGPHCGPTLLNSLPEIDNIVLPWLQWETWDDASVSCKKKKESSINTIKLTWEARQDQTSKEDVSTCCISSNGSWTPAVEFSSNIAEARMNKSTDTCSVTQSSVGGSRRSQIDVGKYLSLKSDEDFLCERWRQKQRISTGALLLCYNKFF